MGSNLCLFLCSRGQPMPVGRNSSNHNSNSNHNSSGGNMYPPMRSSLPGGATLTPGPPSHRSSGSSGMDGRGGGSAGIHSGRTGSNLTITPSVTITPTSAPAVGSKSRNVSCKVSGRRVDHVRCSLGGGGGLGEILRSHLTSFAKSMPFFSSSLLSLNIHTHIICCTHSHSISELDLTWT